MKNNTQNFSKKFWWGPHFVAVLFFKKMKMKNNKRGQVTIFIIIALLLVVIALFVFLFYPKLKTGASLSADSPQVYMRNCVKPTLEDSVEKISLQGGSLEPEFFYEYLGEKLNYLCYTNDYYEFCVSQITFLRAHVEEEITKAVQTEVDECFDSLIQNYQSQGYTVDSKKGTLITELLPGRILIHLQGFEISTEKGGESKKYSSFSLTLNNNLYQFIDLANKITEDEATKGFSDNNAYMGMYVGLKLPKIERTDGTTIYIIEDQETKQKFQFAIRNLVIPPGY